MLDAPWRAASEAVASPNALQTSIKRLPADDCVIWMHITSLGILCLIVTFQQSLAKHRSATSDQQNTCCMSEGPVPDKQHLQLMQMWLERS